MTERLSLRLRRLLDATPERVWAAWTQPELMQQWLSPMGMTTVAATADVRVGGRYRIEMAQGPERLPTPPQFGDVLIAEGSYRRVERPRLLELTWAWVGWRETSIVRIELRGRGDQTELLLDHRRLADEDSRTFHRNGWRSTLDSLRLNLIRDAGQHRVIRVQHRDRQQRMSTEEKTS